MRIKRITPTNRFKHIDLKNIQELNEHYILTPNGWSNVKSFAFTRRAKSKIIKTEKFKLICDEEHILQTYSRSQKIAIHAKDLNPVTHKLISYEGPISFTITDGGEEDFYDIQIESPHWWFTSGVVSHNSILLCNNAISSVSGMGPDGTPGQNVLMITFELDTLKTAMRCLGAATNIPLNQIVDHQDLVRRTINTLKQTYNKRFAIFEWAPDECSVTHIYALLDNLRRTESFRPDVIVLDYMDLMISRNNEYNKDDYTRQKHISNEIRGLAINENVLVFTATQTNRSGSTSGPTGEDVADLNKAAESFGKQFALDYVISLNQSRTQRRETPPQLTMYIAKNRNGPRNERIECEIDYNTMICKELT